MLRSLLPRRQQAARLLLLRCRRHHSRWMASPSAADDGASASGGTRVDVERLFIDDDVQRLLVRLTGANKFSERNIERPERAHYALMTDEMLEDMKSRMEERGRHYLQFVPVKEPRRHVYTVLARDAEIDGFDTSKFVFTDITFDATDQDRTVVVREPDGTLRTALPEEHDRMNRTFYQQPDRPVAEPPLFSEPQLTTALQQDKHEFVLDWAAHFFEPDDPRFVQLCRHIFDDTARRGKFQLLHATRHFGAFAFYLALNDDIEALRLHLRHKGDAQGQEDLQRLRDLLRGELKTLE